MPGEHTAVQQPGQQVLRGVRALRVGEPHEAADARASRLVPADVRPALEVRRRVADVDDGDHAERHRGRPHVVPRRVGRRQTARWLARDRVQEERPCASGASAREFDDGRVEVGEVDDGDGVEPVRSIGELFGEVVVAAAHPGRPIVTDELEQLPVAARVHQAMVDADPVHPSDALCGGRVVLRMQDDGSAALVGQLDEAGQELLCAGSALGRQRAQQVAGDAEREPVGPARHPRGPGTERVVVGREARYLPMGVDVDDHGAPPRARE
jgi:hypothetical protein